MPDTRSPDLRQRRRTLLKEVLAFGIVGGVNFVVDLGIYQVMYASLGQGALWSKVISTTVTSTLAYFLHRHWSFSHRARSGVRREFVLFIALSVASLILGLAVIGGVRYGLGHSDVAILQAANVTSIVLGAIFRFWAYKRFVFLPSEGAPAEANEATGATGRTAVEFHVPTPQRRRVSVQENSE